MAFQTSFQPQQVQVSNRLTHGKRRLVQIQLAFEHHRQNVYRAAKANRTGFHHLVKPIAMMVV